MKSAFDTLRSFDAGNGVSANLYSLPALEEQGVGPVSKLPVSIRIVLESVLRNCDGTKVQERWFTSKTSKRTKVKNIVW